MKFRFDENDDLVLDDIPDDLFDKVNRAAAAKGVSAEDEWREIITKWSKNFDKNE